MQSVRWKGNETSNDWKDVPKQQIIITKDLCLCHSFAFTSIQKTMKKSTKRTHSEIYGILEKKEIKNREKREKQMFKHLGPIMGL